MSEHDLPQKIRDLRAMHNLTLEQVAQQVGVGKSTIRKWETGMIENMRRDKIAKLATALHTTPAYLMGWDECASRKQSGYWDGARLAEERISQGYSTNQMAGLLEISEEEYIQLESGAFEPSFKLLVRLADIFAYDLDYLCHRSMKLEKASPKHSCSEALILKKLRALNDDGKSTVLLILDHEYQKSTGEKAPPAAKNA